MSVTESRMTKQGQIPVPASVQEKLGLAPGTVVEWHEEGDRVFVSRAKRYSFQEIHDMIFPEPPEPMSIEQMDEAIRNRMKQKYARD